MKNLITSRLTAFLCAAVMVLGLTACGAKITGLSLPAGAVLEKGETLYSGREKLTFKCRAFETKFSRKR